MNPEIKKYLEDIYHLLKLEPEQKKELVRELYLHLKEEIEELSRQGLSQDEAIKKALDSFGHPHLISQKINEVYNIGCLREAFLGALPHFLCSLFFALRLWTNIFWLLGLTLLTLIVSLYGWRRGRPIWLFPWLGYSLLPFIGLGFLLLSLPPWSYLGFLVYIPLGWKLFLLICDRTIRRDWLYLSLSLLPFPLLSLSILAWRTIEEGGFYLGLASVSPWFSISFFSLGFASMSFILSSHRPVRAGTLLTPELILLITIALSAKIITDILSLWLLLLITIAVLLSPAIMQRSLFKEEARLDKWLR